MATPIDLVARTLPGSVDPLVVALRWTIARDQFFPGAGFVLETFSAGAQVTVRQAKLPGTSLGAGGWTIDTDLFKRDVQDRSRMSAGTKVPAFDQVKELEPILRFALDEPDPADLERDLQVIAEQLGQSHGGDAALQKLYWRNGEVPSGEEIARKGQGDPEYQDVVRHYRVQATDLLLAAAIDFGMAKLLGLACEHELPAGTKPGNYSVTGLWQASETSWSSVHEAGAEWPPAPINLSVSARTGMAGYPDFGPFFNEQATWHPALPNNDVNCARLAEAARRGPRSYPTPTAKLEWSTTPLKEGPGRDGGKPQLTYEPVSWRIERCKFADNGAAGEARPLLPANAVFSLCHDGERVARRAKDEFEDDLDLPWGEQPLDGFYAYRVAATDIFGVTGAFCDAVTIRLADTFAPPPPRPSIAEERIDLVEGAANTVRLTLDWDAGQELVAPDTLAFQVRQLWTSVDYFPLTIVKTEPIKDTAIPPDPLIDALDHVQADVVLANADGAPWQAGELPSIAGGTLLTADGEFAILDQRGASAIRVRRSAGRAPSPGDASARYPVAAAPVDQPAYARIPISLIGFRGLMRGIVRRQRTAGYAKAGERPEN